MDTPESSYLVTLLASTVLLSILFAIDYTGLYITDSFLLNPIRLIVAALLYSIAFTYYASKTKFRGSKLFVTVFSLLYGVHYLSLTLESLYLGGFFSSNMINGLLINGGITSAIYSWFLAQRMNRLNEKKIETLILQMPISEWIWKLFAAGVTYLILFLIFGIFVFTPIANSLDPSGYLLEQGMIEPSRLMWVFPTEMMRGVLWVIVSIPVIRSLDYGWKKTGIVLASLYAVPMSASMLLPTSMSNGIVISHIVEIFGENLVYGFLTAWILGLGNRLPIK